MTLEGFIGDVKLLFRYTRRRRKRSRPLRLKRKLSRKNKRKSLWSRLDTAMRR